MTWTAILSTLAKLYAAGVSIDWRQVDGPVGACRPRTPDLSFRAYAASARRRSHQPRA